MWAEGRGHLGGTLDSLSSAPAKKTLQPLQASDQALVVPHRGPLSELQDAQYPRVLVSDSMGKPLSVALLPGGYGPLGMGQG